MKSLRNPTTLVCFMMCAATVISTALLAGHAQANGTIYGCTRRPNGQLRVVSSTGQCNPSENEISWSSGGGTSLGEHHQDVKLRLAPNEVRQIALPQTSNPIVINGSTSAVHFNDGNTAPPMITGAVYSYDSVTGLGRMVPNFNWGAQVQNDDFANLNLNATPDNFLEINYAVAYQNAEPVDVTVSLWY